MGRKIRFQAKCHHRQLYKFSISSELLELSLWWRLLKRHILNSSSLTNAMSMTNGCFLAFKLVAIFQIWTSQKVPSLVDGCENSHAVSNAAHSSFCSVKVKPVREQVTELWCRFFFPPSLSNNFKKRITLRQLWGKNVIWGQWVSLSVYIWRYSAQQQRIHLILYSFASVITDFMLLKDKPNHRFIDFGGVRLASRAPDI